jgi:hypothetical protein
MQSLGPGSSRAGGGQSTATPATLAVQLRHKLEGLDLTADLAVNELAVDGVRRYSSTPLRMSVDLAPPSKRLQGLMYRIGLQGVLAPRQLVGRSSGAGGSSSSSGRNGGSSGDAAASYALAVHMQVRPGVLRLWGWPGPVLGLGRHMRPGRCSKAHGSVVATKEYGWVVMAVCHSHCIPATFATCSPGGVLLVLLLLTGRPRSRRRACSVEAHPH